MTPGLVNFVPAAASSSTCLKILATWEPLLSPYVYMHRLSEIIYMVSYQLPLCACQSKVKQICNYRTHDRPGLFRVLISPGAPRRVQLPTSDLRQGSGNAATSMTFPKWQVQIHKMRFRGRWSTAAADIRATTSRLSCATSCREIGSNILHVAHLEFSISEDNR